VVDVTEDDSYQQHVEQDQSEDHEDKNNTSKEDKNNTSNTCNTGKYLCTTVLSASWYVF